MADDDELDLDEDSGSGPNPWIPMLVGTLLTAVIVIGAVWFLLGGVTEELSGNVTINCAGGSGGDSAGSGDGEDEDGEAGPKVPIFHPLEKFTVNIQGKKRDRAMVLELKVLSFSQTDIDAVIQYGPVIRDGLMDLFSGQSYRDMKTRKGKKALKAETLKIIQDIMQEYHGSPAIEKVFFTKLVTQ
jgi:flagellar protein FliL